MTLNSLTQYEGHDIPSQIMKTILDCMPQLFFRPQYVWFLTFVYIISVIPHSSGQLTRLIVYIIPLE